MIHFDDYANENKTQYNLKQPYTPDHPYRILIIGGSGSGKANAQLNLINNQPDIDKIYLYAKDPYEAKYQYLINKREKVGLNHYDDPKAFTEYSNNIQDVYKKIDEHNIDREHEKLIVFDDMIADMINDKKDVRLNTTHFFVMKIPKERELQQVALNNSSDINSIDFIKIYKKSTSESYSFLVNDATLASDNPLRFRKNLFNI